MNAWHPGYIVVEGPIGVGKTSLARRLADAFSGQAQLEQPDENPFLERFYQSPRHFALPTQLFFLFQRARQIQALKQRDMFTSGYVTDFLFEKDKLFARINLDDDELRLYEQVYAQLSLDLPVPDLPKGAHCMEVLLSFRLKSDGSPIWRAGVRLHGRVRFGKPKD